ncbi:MAG: quinone-dependent dihydroorotate dehydrogenase [Alphaproteobacteria bacterium]|nr:quinone-dependent dihydroorotate dehydrogenase [Alphaproteobacteria bacterium]
MDPYAFILPLIRTLEPERAHRLTVRALAMGFGPAQRQPDDPALRTRVFGLEFPNPLGLAAGFDKNAEVWRAALRMGFGFVETGTVTPLPQQGNPRPRLFRLAEDAAVINRMGFNNDGIEAAARNLAGPRPGIVGVNIGKNRDTGDPVADYAACAARLGPLADYLVVNVSSPNTPGLRALQGPEALTRIVDATSRALRRACPDGAPPILVKIAPDLTGQDREDIASVARGSAIAGLIVANTTIGRPAGLRSRWRSESGGLSGKPLFAPSTELLADMYRLTGGAVPLIGVGGIASGGDAYRKIRAGASLIQVYTAFVYQGPVLIQRIKDELAALLRADGYDDVDAAVGAQHC